MVVKTSVLLTLKKRALKIKKSDLDENSFVTVSSNGEWGNHEIIFLIMKMLGQKFTSGTTIWNKKRGTGINKKVNCGIGKKNVKSLKILLTYDFDRIGMI